MGACTRTCTISDPTLLNVCLSVWKSVWVFLISVPFVFLGARRLPLFSPAACPVLWASPALISLLKNHLTAQKISKRKSCSLRSRQKRRTPAECVWCKHRLRFFGSLSVSPSLSLSLALSLSPPWVRSLSVFPPALRGVRHNVRAETVVRSFQTFHRTLRRRSS